MLWLSRTQSNTAEGNSQECLCAYRYSTLVSHGPLHQCASPSIATVSQLRTLTRHPIPTQEILCSWLHRGSAFRSWAEHIFLPSAECPKVSRSTPCSKVQNWLREYCSWALWLFKVEGVAHLPGIFSLRRLIQMPMPNVLLKPVSKHFLVLYQSFTVRYSDVPFS